MTPEQLLQRIKKENDEGSGLTHDTLIIIKKFLEDAKNAQNNQNLRPPDLLTFKEKMIGYAINTLSKCQPVPKDKILMLEILERDLISSKHNINLFNKLYHFLLEQDQNVAIQASKTIDALIKQINQGQLATPGAPVLDIRNHYIKLFEFLKQKTEFLLKLSEHSKGEQFKIYRRQSYQQREKDKQKQKKQVVFKNNKSLKFINQVPHLFIHLMAYVDTTNRGSEDDAKIKQLIRKSIQNIILALRKTPYQEFYQEFNYDFNNQLFAVMTKLLQFLFINLRTDKDSGNTANRSNQNLKKNIADQAENIKVPEVIKNFIYLLKNCSEDFQLNRYEIVNRLRLLLTNLDKNKLSKNDAIEIMNQILNEEIIFGKKKILGDYSKNAICSYWIEIIKSSVLINNVFPPNILSIRMISQNPTLQEDSKQIAECFNNIQKLVEEVMKTIFDNSIYPSVQEKSIDLIIFFIDQLFPEGIEQDQTSNYINFPPNAKRVHEYKMKILLKILHSTSAKFLSIRETFQEIEEYVTKKLGHKATKKDLPEPLKVNHMQLSTLPVTTQSENWKGEFVDFIEKYDQNIDSSLLTLSAVQNRFLTIYEEDDELCFNSHPVKLSNYTLYMKEVKTKLLEKCIILANKITKTFLTQNPDTYSPVEMQSLKSIYYVVSNKRNLTSDQCKILSCILKNGLKIFEVLHNYDLHSSDQQTNKRGHLKNFMLIFAQIYDPVNFRDIFEPNMNQFFRNLIIYAKNCSEYCLQHVLIEPYCSNQQNQMFNKNIVQLLTYNLILRLESTSDQLDPFHEFYDYKQEYFLLLQKLIRFPFRCLSRYSDDSFIRNYFRQIILFLTKKAHTSRFCLDYLHLMRTLFKNILFNSNRESASPLFQEFYAICCKNSSQNQVPVSNSSTFVNVNILQNFLKFFDTGIPELADIVTQLVIMLPLKSKHIIQFAKQGYIVRPLLHCLCLMSDYNYLLRTLKTFEIIISHSTAQEINNFLQGVKDKLINRLFEMVINEYKSGDLKPQKINNDLSSLSLKLLAKLGCLSRNRDLQLQMKQRTEENNKNHEDFLLVYEDFHNKDKKFDISLLPSIEYALQVFHKLLDSYYQSVVYISMQIIQKCFYLLMDTLPYVLTKMHPLAQRIIAVFASILALSSKYLTISQSILSKLRQSVKACFKDQAKIIKDELSTTGFTEYSKFFIKCIIQNMSERVLITREDNFIKEISQEPKRFIWEVVVDILQSLKTLEPVPKSYEQTCEYVIRLLISQIIMVKNPNHVYLNNYQRDYNYVLPFKNGALSALNELLDTVPDSILQSTSYDILNSIFIVVGTLSDILNLKISKHPQVIARKVYQFLLKDEQKFLTDFKTQKGEQVFTCILQNLVGYSVQAHKIAIMFLHMIMNETNLKLHELLFGNIPWEEIQDNTCASTRSQCKIFLSEFSKQEKEGKKYPISPLIKSLLRISHIPNLEYVKNQKYLKTLTNTFATFELLISIKHKEDTYQAFQILSKIRDSQDFAQDNVTFNENFRKIIGIAQELIAMNSNIYESYTKIILEQQNPAQQQQQQQPQQPQQPQPVNPNQPRPQVPVPPQPQQAPGQNVPPPGQQPPPRARDPNQPQQNAPLPPQPPSQTFNINTNTFIDDEEYGLNIEDLDMEIKVWGGLLSSILKFLKTILVNKTIFSVSKQLLKKKAEKNSKMIDTRLEIIFVMFELIGRVDRSVRDTAYECIKDLLSREEHPKQLIQNDEKLKHILRPVLISLQLQFKKFTPSFLTMFKKILKLLTQCFNITLIQKLVDKLREMDRSRQIQANPTRALAPVVPGTKQLNYCEITNEVKCIANFLGLFQHLAYAYHNHRSQNYTVNSVIIIFKYITNISKFFAPKLGKHTITVYIKKTLSKVFNTMCQKLSGQAIFGDNQQREFDYESFLELIKLDQSFPLRQKLTRQTSYIQKTFTQYAKTKKRDYYIFLDIVYNLAKRSNRWMKNLTSLANRIGDEIKSMVEYKNRRFEERRQSEKEWNDRNELVLLCKILLEYCKQNTDDTKALFSLVELFKVRSTIDLHFLRRYLKQHLNQRVSKQTKRKIFLQFMTIVKSPPTTGDAQKILAISQNIIYNLILTQVNTPDITQRAIIIKDQQIMKSVAQTIKLCLNPRNLYIKGNTNFNPKHISYTYRIGIQVLQITNLMIGAYKDIIDDNFKNMMLLTVWGLLRIEDKIIKNYAFVWTSNYIRVFEGFDHTRALGLYLTLIRGLESLSQGDFQIGALIKKSLNILIPYWDNKPPSASGNWIEWSLKAVHQESSEPNRLVRFWEIVVKNHAIFHKFKENKFETQMVNSMQWLMVANNPTSSNPLIKKIASDMSFIYIEWKFKEAQSKLKEKLKPEEKEQSIDEINKDTNIDRAAEICLNFFIKVALNNSNDKDDKEIMKRSLYLLKKTLILWPHTKKKFESIKVIVNKLKGAQSPNAQISPEMPLRFHYTLLNIINILMSYEPDVKLLPQLTMIFKLLQLGGHISPQRFGANGTHPQPPAASTGTTIFTMNNIYLLHLLCTIVKRLVSIAHANEGHQESQKLMQEIHSYIRDGFEYHTMSANRSRTAATAQRAIPMKKIEVEVAISFLKILYQMDPKLVQTHLNYIKQVASSLKKMFQKGFETSSKNNNPSRVFELPPLKESSLQQMLDKDLEINVDLVKEENLNTFEQNYEKQNIKSYSTRRPLFVVLIRILASKFNCISHMQDKTNALDIFVSIYQKIPDPQLKIQVINILKCMFIGPGAFKSSQVPMRYRDIPPIIYPTNKIFFLLFEDNNKFNEHFERRKSKPSDQSYNINQRIYEQITTKIYFSFLCSYIVHLENAINEMKPIYLEKVKVFVLYAVKIVEGELIDQVLDILNKSYQSQAIDLYSNLFEDYKELNCAEEYLQGDEIMIFLTAYLYKKSIQNYKVSTQIFNSESMVDFHKHFVTFLKVQHSSPHHITNISNTFRLATTKLLPQGRNFPRILKDYLLTGSYTETWGSVLLKVAINECNCLNANELYQIATRISEWGLLVEQLEKGKSQECYVLLDFVYRAYGDSDLINGYRMMVSNNADIQRSLALLQQRKYIESLQIVNELESQKLKRMIVSDDDTTEESIASLQELLQDNCITDISKECYKNLDKWEEILEERNEPLDMEGRIDYLFYSKGQKNKITDILNNLEQLNTRQFPYFYGKSILNFLESNTVQNKELNISLLYSLLEWLSFPKNAVMNQNRMLVKIECLLELQEGEKIKEQSLTASSEHPMLVDALTKVVQSVYTQINAWRQRMPYKHEDMSTWHAILGQRIMIYDFMKNKMLHLLDSVLKSSSHTHNNMQTATEKLLIPYTDIEWNKLKLCKQQRTFGIYQSHTLSQPSGSLYLDEIFLKEKEKFYYAFEQEKDHPKALQVIENALKQIHKEHGSQRDEELIKLQKLQLMRLKAKIFVKDGQFEAANDIYIENVKGVEQHLLSLWRDWMVMCVKAYEHTKKPSWAKSAIAVFPYALRYKCKKTRLLLGPIINICKELANDQSVVKTLADALESIPYKNLILWLPQLMKLTESNERISPVIAKILSKLNILFPQIIFYAFKPLFRGIDLKVLKQAYLNAKKQNYNVLTKLQNFMAGIVELRNQKNISISTMGFLSRCFAEVQIPLYENYKGDCEETMIPYISQIDEKIETELFNGVECKFITLLGTDGKEYRYRLEKYQKVDKKEPLSPLDGVEYNSMVASQLLEIAHSQLGFWKESAIRKLKILETRKIYVQEDFAIFKSSKSQVTMHDILGEFLAKKTQFDPDYPESDKSFFANQKLSKVEINKSINKRMKEIVPRTVMKEYFSQKALNYDEYNSFRKIFAYQYGTICALHHILGIETGLQNLTFDMKNGFIQVNSLKFNFEDPRPSPFSLRLSRNVVTFLDKTLLNAGILPAFAATVDALSNDKFNFKKYLVMVHKDLSAGSKSSNNQESFIAQRLQQLSSNLDKVRKIIEGAELVANCGQVPPHMKYWF